MQILLSQGGAFSVALPDPVSNKHFCSWKGIYEELCSTSTSASWTIDFAQKRERTKFTQHCCYLKICQRPSQPPENWSTTDRLRSVPL